MGLEQLAPETAVGNLALELIGGAFVGLSLGLVGAGGAIFSVPIFAVLLHHPPAVAVAEALAVTGCIALFSGVRAALQGRVDWMRALAFAVPGLLGAWAGGPLGERLSGRLQALVFAIVAVVAAWRMATQRRGAPRDATVDAPPGGGAPMQQALQDAMEAPALSSGRALLISIAAGFAIGMLTSVIGVGGGFLLVPALVFVARAEMTVAVGTSLLVIAVNAGVGLASNRMHHPSSFDGFDVGAVAIVTAGGVAGSLLGAVIAGRLNQLRLRRAFAALVVVAAVAVLLKAFAPQSLPS